MIQLVVTSFYPFLVFLIYGPNQLVDPIQLFKHGFQAHLMSLHHVIAYLARPIRSFLAAFGEINYFLLFTYQVLIEYSRFI